MKLDIQKKVDGQLLNANEINQIVDAINEIDLETKKSTFSLDPADFVLRGTATENGQAVPNVIINPDRVPEGGGGGQMTRDQILAILGVIPPANLPDATLSPLQFEVLPNQNIGIRTDYLQSVVGGNPTPSLGTSTLSATVMSSTQINLSWLMVSGAESWTLQRATSLDFSDAVAIYVGNALTFANIGLSPSTTYRYRVRPSAAGYLDGPWSATAATTQAGGATTPAAPTSFIVDDVNNTGDWTPNPNYPLLSDTEQTLDGGLNVTLATVKPLVVGNVAKNPGQVGVRIKSASGRNASPWLFNSEPYTTGAGEPYVVEKTYRVNFANEYGATPPEEAPYWNTFKPPSSIVQTINGFTSPGFVDEENNPSSITLKNTGAFGGTTAEVANTQQGVDGTFHTTVINTAWSISGSTSAKLLISGLNPAKFYQFYFLMPVSSIPSTRGISIGGVAKNKVATTITASFGTIGLGLSDPELIVYNNITGSSVEISVNRISGDFGAFIAAMVIEQSNVNKV